MKIWGREPTLWIGTAQAVLVLLVTFNLPGLSGSQAGLITAALSAIAGAWAAWATRPIAPQAFTYLVGAVAALTGAYGLDFSPEQIGAANGVVTVVLALLARSQVSPVADSPVKHRVTPY